MYCVSRFITEETETTKKYLANFTYCGLDVSTINSYDVIKSHFQNFKIDREFNYFLNDIAGFSVSHLRFLLHNNESNEVNNYVSLFSIIIEASSWLESEYRYSFREDEDYFKEQLDNSFNEIRIEMTTTFYLNLTDENNNLDDDDIETIMPPIQNVFEDDNCLVCLENKPNIIFSPCNHFVVCEKCDEKGKFISCIKCREEICSKLRLKKQKTICVEQTTQTDEKVCVEQTIQTDEKVCIDKSTDTNEYEKAKKEKPNSIEEHIKIIEEKLEKLELKNGFLKHNLEYGKEKEDSYEGDLEDIKNEFELPEEKIKKKKFFYSWASDERIKENKDTIKDFLAKLLREVDDM